MVFSLRLDLARNLLELDDYKLCWFERRETNNDVDDAEVDVVLGGSFLVTLNEVSISRCRALEGSLAEEVLHEGADIQTDLRPEWFVVRLEDHELRAAKETLFDVECSASYGNVFPFRGEPVVALESARSPNNAAGRRLNAQTVNAERIQFAILCVR